MFLAVPVLGVGTFAVAPFFNIWLPADVSEPGRSVARLFMFIPWLTGAVFVINEILLFWFMWKYVSTK